MFHYAQINKHTPFLSICVGGYRGAFQISLNVLYETIFNYTLSLKQKVNLLEKKDKRPNLYNKKILVLDTLTH